MEWNELDCRIRKVEKNKKWNRMEWVIQVTKQGVNK